ncbi:molybdate ABC transporter permease subunit [Vibrio ulleungensis]|uniref:Molybdenum transport system permease n=1 Tax=Vibrio ulleungensis TaxID=2807619 RepID=A0ABS2HHR4_9VIBR|nr:molybdate ABC transporter permease subunit [Vibrio ulleungensis]MBM7035708.1 molybdate ABC transporter permease subunit [Vibrio ulleungensis]
MSLSQFELDAILLSLKVAFVALCWLLPLGLALGWLLARKQFLGKSLVDALIHLPLILPPVVVGYLLLITFGRYGWLGDPLYRYFGVEFGFSWKGAVIASVIVSLPLIVRAIRQAIEQVDTKLEKAAHTLGHSPWQVFWRVTLPLAWPGVISGAVLAFARSLGEFGATITFVSSIPGETQTIPLAMYNFVEIPGMEYQAARLCVIAIAIALGSMILSNRLSKSVR